MVATNIGINTGTLYFIIHDVPLQGEQGLIPKIIFSSWNIGSRTRKILMHQTKRICTRGRVSYICTVKSPFRFILSRFSVLIFTKN
jgi:hypothetical protein